MTCGSANFEGCAGDGEGVRELGQGTLSELGYGCAEVGEGDEGVAWVVEDGGVGGGRKLRKEARCEHWIGDVPVEYTVCMLGHEPKLVQTHH